MPFTETNFLPSLYLQNSSYNFSFAGEFTLNRPDIYTATDRDLTGVGNNGAFFPLLHLYYNNTNSSFFIDQEFSSKSYIRGAGASPVVNWFDVSALAGSNTWWEHNVTHYILFNFSATSITIRFSKVKANQQFSGTAPGWTFSSYPVTIQSVNVGGTPLPTVPFYFRGTINNIIFSATALTWNQAFNNDPIN